MKKVNVFTILIVLIIMFLSACSNQTTLQPGRYDSEDGTASVILEDENKFEFRRHFASSYAPTGEYIIEDNKLVLQVNDDEYYTFSIKDNQLIFEDGTYTDSFLSAGTVFTLSD